MAIVVGFVFLCLLGVIHYFGQQAIRASIGKQTALRKPLVAFMLLAVLHLFEIGLYALGYGALGRWGWPEGLAALTSWQDYLYLSFITYTTLGFTELAVDGDVRILVGMQALGGFMVLTWSATFLYQTDQQEEREER